MSDPRTDLPSTAADNFPQRVREALMTYMGRQGNPLDRGITLRDLVANGFAQLKSGYALRLGGDIPMIPGSSVQGAYEVDLTPPPMPTGFAVSAAISNVFIQHDQPVYTQGHGHLRTHVYGVIYTSGALPTFANAVELTQFSGIIFAYPTNPATTWRLWIKWESVDGVLSATPAGGTNGLAVTTGQDVSKLLQALAGQITESQLYAALGARINLIDGPSTSPGTVAYQVAQEAAGRANDISIESHQRLLDVQSAAQSALNAALAADTERVNRTSEIALARSDMTTQINAGVSAEAAQRTLLATQLTGGYTGTDVTMLTAGLLYSERLARSTQDTALALQITLLSAGVGEQFDWKQIWYFDTGVEAWTGNGAPSSIAGFLRPASQTSGAYVLSPTGLAVDGAKYKQVRLRIRKVGAPTFAGYLWWADVAQLFDVTRRISITEPSYDANSIGIITLNMAWTGNIDALRLDLSSAQTATDYFEIDWFAVGRPSPGASTAQLLDEQTARATADSSETTARQTLATSILGQADPTGLVLGNLTAGLLFSEKQARSTADSAMASDITTLQASLTTTNGNVTTLSSNVTSLSNAVATAQQTSATVTQELLSVNRHADQDAETLLRNVIAGQNTIDAANSMVAVAKLYLETKIDDGLAAESTARLTLAAAVNNNAALILQEQTARANADSSLTTSVNTLSASVATKNRTYSQSTAPTVALVTGDLWYDTSNNNQLNRWDGAAWIASSDPRIAANTAAIQSEATARANADTALASSITTLTATVNDNTAAIQSEATTRSTADSANASAINTVQSNLTVTNGNVTTAQNTANTAVASVQTEATTRATETGSLFAKYTVKVDIAGFVSGFGLASDANNAAPYSQFGVRADQFFIAPPSVASPTAPTSNLFVNYVWLDTSVTPNVTRYYTGSVWSTTPQLIPFAVQTTPTVINGVSVPPGVYMDTAFIKNGTITNLMIGNAQVDTAKIADLAVSTAKINDLSVTSAKIADANITTAKIATAAITTALIADAAIASAKIADAAITSAKIAASIQSDNYVAGSAGWIINKAGSAEFRNIVVRGDVEATSLNAATGTFSGTLTAAAVNAVNTINIGIDQVTVPRSYYTSGAIGLTTTETVIQSGFISVTAGQPVIIWVSAQFFASIYYVASAYLNLYDPDGILIYQGGFSDAGNVLYSMPVAGIGYATKSGTYTLKASGSIRGGTDTLFAQYRTMVMLGAKR